MQASNIAYDTDDSAKWQNSVPDIAWGTLLLLLGVILAYVLTITYTLGGYISYPVATLICSYLAFASFTVMHDAGHGSIFNLGSALKPLESLIGWIASIPMLIVPYRIFQKIHDRHHAFTNDPERDPDYIGEPSTWFGLLLSLYYTPIKYHVMSLTSLRHIKVISDTYASSMVYIVVVYGSLITITLNGYTLEVVCFALIPVGIALFFLVMFFDYVPHHPHKSLGRFQNTRIFEGRFLNCVLLGQNYHLIHHLYPRLPWYKYEGVYAEILPELVYNGAPLEKIGFSKRPSFMSSPNANNLQQDAGLVHRLMKVSHIKKLTADAVAVNFELPSGESLRYKSGQYITVSKWLNNDQQTRCYSLCSAPENGQLKIAVRETSNGLVSGYMNQRLQLGDELIVQGPFGDFIYPPTHEKRIDDLVLISGGSGITPVLSILETALKKQSVNNIYLIYACRDITSIMFFGHLKQLQADHPKRFHLHYVIADAVEPSLGKSRRLDEAMLVSLLPWLSNDAEASEQASVSVSGKSRPENTEYYVCGPEGLKNTVIDSLNTCLVDASRVHVEAFVSTITKPVGQLHTVDITLAGGQKHALNVAANQTVLEVAKAEGVMLPHACGNGTCGSCKLKVERGEVANIADSVPGIMANEKAAGYTLACQCKPMSCLQLAENLNQR
ncbi:MAG: ferredoxin-NADP reductase/fatty acid desaturase [Oleiphilaceae bacterium]|jgi:ferredoxin-NADP reductase/fatty acid desaturase